MTATPTPFLMYNRVEDEHSTYRHNISSRAFEEQLQFVAACGTETIPRSAIWCLHSMPDLETSPAVRSYSGHLQLQHCTKELIRADLGDRLYAAPVGALLGWKSDEDNLAE